MANVIRNFSHRLISGEFETKIEDYARDLFSDVLVTSLQLRAENDHDGDPVLKMDIEHSLIESDINLALVRERDNKIRDRAWELGDSRFLHIRHTYDEKQTVSLSDE